MINTKKVLLITLAILIPVIAIISSIYLVRKGSEEVKGISEKVKSCTPYITNMMPNTASVGESYYFSPKIVGCDIDEVTLSLDGAEWLSIGEGRYISGIPTSFDIGIHRVVLTISSIGNSSRYIEYIAVE